MGKLKENKNSKCKQWLKILSIIVIVLITTYSIVCLVRQKIVLSNYYLDEIKDNSFQGTNNHSLLEGILVDTTRSFYIDKSSAIKDFDKELKNIYFNSTAESQEILKYKSCNLYFNADENQKNNHHYANLVINFEIQNKGWIFFPKNYFTGNKIVSITRNIDLKKTIVSISTEQEITNIDNTLNYHNGDIIQIKAAAVGTNKECILKGIVTQIQDNSINIDFDDASIDYYNLKYSIKSLKKID